MGKTKLLWVKSPKAERKKREKARKNIFRLDRFRVLILVGTVGVPAIAFGLLRMLTRITQCYIVKMSYSVDKELIFLKRVGTLGRLREEVVEAAHLEVPPPTAISRIGDLSSADPNGIWRITNLASVDYLDSILLYNNDKYWNPKLKEEFLSQVIIFLFRDWDFGVKQFMDIIDKKPRIYYLQSKNKLTMLTVKKLYQLIDNSTIIIKTFTNNTLIIINNTQIENQNSYY